MNNKQQTPVNIFFDSLVKNGIIKRVPIIELQEALKNEKEQMIDFASWIAKSEWMSIWVVDKWMWECQKENSNTNYKTDKELFDIYYNETYGGNKWQE